MVALPTQPPRPAVALVYDRDERKEILAPYLPGILRQDPFLVRLLGAFDDVWRPLIELIDGIDAYFDAGLTPPAQLASLARWLGEELPETLPEAVKRALVRETAALHRARGTKAGLRRAIELVAGVEPLITENTAGLRLDADARLGINTSLEDFEPNIIHIALPAGTGNVDQEAVGDVIRALKPAHATFAIRTLEA